MTQPTHNKGHTLDLLASSALEMIISADLDADSQTSFDYYFVLMILFPKKVVKQTVQSCYLTYEVAENFVDLFHRTPTIVLIILSTITLIQE